MVKCSNFVLFFVNIFSLLLSIMLIVVSFHLNSNPNSQCWKFIRQPILYFGFFLMFISLIGLIGACSRVHIFLWIYTAVMFLLIVGVFCFTIFTIVVTNKGIGKVVSGQGIGEHRLGDYSNWLQKYVASGKNWETIKNCLSEKGICTNDALGRPSNPADIQKMPLIQTGCCMPSMYCGFTYVNATIWDVPKTGKVAPTKDCKTWSNNQNTLCFECDSCKIGYIESMKKEWKAYTKSNIFLLIILLVVYSIASCAFKNNRNDSFKR